METIVKDVRNIINYTVDSFTLAVIISASITINDTVPDLVDTRNFTRSKASTVANSNLSSPLSLKLQFSLVRLTNYFILLATTTTTTTSTSQWLKLVETGTKQARVGRSLIYVQGIF